MKIRGSCLCGSVRYEVQGPLAGAGHCHGPMCRKWSGAACGTEGFIAPEQFRWTAGEDLVERYPSSPGKDRCFCRRCGSPLVAAHGGAISEVVLGSIDGDPMVRPREHIFVAHKAPWHEISDALPQHREWPPEATSPRYPTTYGRDRELETSVSGEYLVAGTVYGGLVFTFAAGRVTRIFLGAAAESFATRR